MLKYIITPLFLAVALAVVLVASLPAGGGSRDVVVMNDPGGTIVDYIAKYRQINQRGDRVVIDGWCASACTMALRYPRTCVTQRAMLGFHQAYFDLLGLHIISPMYTQMMYGEYPYKVRKWINAHGGLQPDVTVMWPSVSRRLFPHCEKG